MTSNLSKKSEKTWNEELVFPLEKGIDCFKEQRLTGSSYQQLVRTGKMPFRIGLIFFGAFAAVGCCNLTVALATSPPNVLLITIDDMNDGISLFGHDRPFKTPHIEQLATRGVFFRRAYCVSAACNPSRAATLTGLRPATTGVYGNATDWRNATKGRLTLPEYFGKYGYHTAGFGKIYHHHGKGRFNDPAAWTTFREMDDQYMPPAKLNGADNYGSRNTDWGAWPKDQDEQKTIDFRSVKYTIDFLKRNRHLAKSSEPAQPFFLACGIFKPHSPFYAPPRYHAFYPDDIPLPLRQVDDWNDLPPGARTLMRPTTWFWKGMESLEKQKPGSYSDFIRAYGACCTFADASIGRLISALDKSGHAGNTIIVLWSDHGFHLGEKDHIEKFALWEKSTHIPFIVVDPRSPHSAGQVCESPIDMTILYPTLVDLCKLPANTNNEGISVATQIQDPKLTISQPALMTYGFNNHAIRSRRWRYIRYADGTEELYDHHNDPNEWNNLSLDSSRTQAMRKHARWMPTKNALPYGDLKQTTRGIKD
ncbi:MAG: sulfatase [Pirellulaceae bacterium]|nr:sulfatase [Pirellulaceae bacterium]